MGKKAPLATAAAGSGHTNGAAHAHATSVPASRAKDKMTDHDLWRLRSERGQQIWHYITPEQAKSSPQTIGEKYFLGRPTGLPTLPKARTPRQAADNGLKFFSALQMDLGNWSCEYGGPMFLLPGIVIAWYVTQTPIPEEYKIEIRNYLFARQNPDDGGWGLHIEGESTVLGCALNYTAMRIVGADRDDPRMIKVRSKLHQLGGATNSPHWVKFWLATMGVVKWSIVNPVPPELWLLPDWVPIAPWRWWIHMRMVFLPMSFVWSRGWVMQETKLVRELREELFTQPYESIDFAAHRNSIAAVDNYHPKSWFLNLINLLLVWIWVPYLRTASLVANAETWVWRLIQYEDANTDWSDLAPVSSPMHMVCCYIKEGADSHSFRMHRSRIADFLWVKDEGMLANGTNGVQTWDTAFAIHAAMDAGLDQDPAHRETLTKALKYLETQQMLENCVDQEKCYRHPRKGAWGFSTKAQGYTVSDCTAEAVKAVMTLQRRPGYPQVVPDERIFQAIDILLTMQNARSGGCSSYEVARGSELLEYLNAAEVFGKIMVEYDYVECTTAVVSALNTFTQHYPSYRAAEISRFRQRAVAYIRRAQRPDGGWYGAWGICFSYAGMFSLEALASEGETWAKSERVRAAVRFFLDRQMADGGWGETYRGCETGEYVAHERSQVVQTAWVVIALVHADYPHREPLERAVRLIMSRQQANGEWLQEAIEGVFNKSCMISYPNYKFIFPIRALGMYARRWGDHEVL